MTRTGDREIRSVSGRLPDNPGELACMHHSHNKSREVCITTRSTLALLSFKGLVAKHITVKRPIKMQ